MNNTSLNAQQIDDLENFLHICLADVIDERLSSPTFVTDEMINNDDHAAIDDIKRVAIQHIADRLRGWM